MCVLFCFRRRERETRDINKKNKKPRKYPAGSRRSGRKHARARAYGHCTQMNDWHARLFPLPPDWTLFSLCIRHIVRPILVGFVQHFKTQWHDQPVETCNLPISSFEGKRVKNKQTKSQKYKKRNKWNKKGKERNRSVGWPKFNRIQSP